MQTVTCCPGCEKQLDIPSEYAGKQVRCGDCQTTFIATECEEIPVVETVKPKHNDGGHVGWMVCELLLTILFGCVTGP